MWGVDAGLLVGLSHRPQISRAFSGLYPETPSAGGIGNLTAFYSSDFQARTTLHAFQKHERMGIAIDLMSLCFTLFSVKWG